MALEDLTAEAQPVDAQAGNPEGGSTERLPMSLFDLDKDPSLQERVFYRSSQFLAIPSLGPVVEGHSLLCPEFDSLFASPAYSIHEVVTSYGWQREVISAVDAVSTLLRNAYGKDVLILEHGGALNDESAVRCGTAYPQPSRMPLALL